MSNHDAAYYRAYRQRHGGKPWAEYNAGRHRHPSLNCYKRHGCRCAGCCAHNTAECARNVMLACWNSVPERVAR